LSNNNFLGSNDFELKVVLFTIVISIVIEYSMTSSIVNYREHKLLQRVPILCYIAPLILCIIIFGNFGAGNFIYFKF